MLLPLHMRAIILGSVMQTHPERIVGTASTIIGIGEIDYSESSSSSSEEQVDNNQRENQTDAAATVVPDSGTHVVAATAEEN
jgi:hypothetical protein